jgi:hypothetical protein
MASIAQDQSTSDIVCDTTCKGVCKDHRNPEKCGKVCNTICTKGYDDFCSISCKDRCKHSDDSENCQIDCLDRCEPELGETCSKIHRKIYEKLTAIPDPTAAWRYFRIVFITVFVLAFVALIGIVIYLVVRDTPFINAVKFAADNDIFCSNTDTAHLCEIADDEYNDFEPPPVETGYNIDSANKAILMINKIYDIEYPYTDIEWTPLYCYHNEDYPYGYAGFDQNNNVNYVIFRGTNADSEEEVKVDLDIEQIDFDGTACHKGFVEEYECFADDIFNTIEEGYPLFTAGHSMGAGYALLTAMTFARTYNQPYNIYVVGSPRICSCSIFDTGLNMDNYFNIQNLVDPIVTQPPSVISMPNDVGSLYPYCTAGTLVQFQNNRLSLWGNHALSTYYHRTEQDSPIVRP